MRNLCLRFDGEIFFALILMEEPVSILMKASFYLRLGESFLASVLISPVLAPFW